MWAIGGWFIPFANLVIPYKVVTDVAEASRPYVPGQPPIAVRRPPVGLWWGAWIVVLILTRFSATHEKAIAARGAPTLVDTLADRPVSYALLFAGTAALWAAALFGSLVVLRITHAQEETAAAQAADYAAWSQASVRPS